MPGPSKVDVDMGNALATVGKVGVSAGFAFIHNSQFTQFRLGTAATNGGAMLVAQGQWDNSHRFKEEQVFTPASINIMSKGNPGWIYVTNGATGVQNINPQTWTATPTYTEPVEFLTVELIELTP